MVKAFYGTAKDLGSNLTEGGLTHAISAGRRAPLHRMHKACIDEIIDAGLTPIFLIGSSNKADSPHYDPLSNPLTVEQQKEQLRRAFPNIYDENLVIDLNDVGDGKKWFKNLVSILDDTDINGNYAFHYRTKASDTKDTDSNVKPLSAYAQATMSQGFSVWESYNVDPTDDDIHASDIRKLNLEQLTDAQKEVIVTDDYIISIARTARGNNPDEGLLKQYNIPVTMLDLSFDRLYQEAGIRTEHIIERAKQDKKITVETLTIAAQSLVNEHNIGMQQRKTFPLKIASASCNQTAGDWPTNITNICNAIDKAVEDGADILSLEELGLSGYERGDDFYYSDNKKTHEMLQIIADYAASQDPNLVISVGHPWYFADKNLTNQDERRKNPIFNRIDNNFNVQTLIAGGEIVSMSAKRYLFNYERGYEARHFEEWSDVAANNYKNTLGKGRNGTIIIPLPELKLEDGSVVSEKFIPFGSPVIQIGSGDNKANLTHIICEEYWIGSRFDSGTDHSDYSRDNPLAQKAREFDITVALNPNASPPAENKIKKHYELMELASKHCDVIVHTDGLGSSGSTFAQFGSRLMAQNGKVTSEGIRASFKDMAYTSQIIEVQTPRDREQAPHAFIPHKFANDYLDAVQDGPATWEKGERVEFEEEMRNELLWMFDYMRKNKIQGITEALSGGADSGYNAAKTRLMVELACSELGVEGFLEAMPHLTYKDKALDVYRSQGTDAAIKAIMDDMLVCVYMGTDNSSDETLNAARTLIEGGVDKTGQVFDGIGGKFHYRNVQRLVEVYAEIYSGVNPSEISNERDIEIRNELANILKTRADDTTPEELNARIEVLKTSFEEVSHDVLSVANEKDIIPYENIQARLRQVLIMLFANVENKLAVANPNLDEARNSYATWGGDLHGGMISGNAHKNKQRQLDHMALLFEHGLEGSVKPVTALYWTLRNRPSAELQPRNKEGKVVQFDEDQLGRSFTQMDVISQFMLYDRPLEQGSRKNNPIEVLEKCRAHEAFAGDDIETLHDRIRLSYDKWAFSQFKIHGSPVAATYGQNVDHQSSMRTPNISSFHKPELAQLALYCIKEIAERDGKDFQALMGGSYDTLSKQALIDKDYAANLSSKMWTKGAIDGRKMKVDTLYNFVLNKDGSSLLSTSKMSDVFNKARSWREENFKKKSINKKKIKL